jgi:hypothetical protein
MTAAFSDKIRLSPEHSMLRKRKIAILSLFYHKDHQIPLHLLVEDFSDNAKPTAVIVRTAGFADI